jgi:hypothetical protein
MTDPLEQIILQAEKIVKENNKVYQFTKISQSQTAFAIRARNTAGDFTSFLTVRGTSDEASWERAFYGQGWMDVNVHPTLLTGSITIASVPSAATTPGDAAFTQRSFSGTATSVSVKPFSFFDPLFSVPGIGLRRFTPVAHTPTTPYGVSSSDNDIQLYFMGLSNDQKYEMRWEGGNFMDWWNERAARAAAPSNSTSHPHSVPQSPEVVAAFAQKIPFKRVVGYDEFLKLMRKVKSGTGATALDILPDEVLIDEYESRTGNTVQTIFALGKERIMKFRDYDRPLMLKSLENLRSVLKVQEDYETAQSAENRIDEDAKDRANVFKNKVNEITGLAGGFLGTISDEKNRIKGDYRP